MSRPGPTHRTMWRFILPPVLAITLIWIAASSATTYYIQWVETSHQRVLDENIASIQSAEELQRIARRILRLASFREAELPDALLSSAIQELHSTKSKLQKSSVTAAEKVGMSEIETLILKVEKAAKSRAESNGQTAEDQAHLSQWAQEIIDRSETLKVINRQLIDAGTSRRTRARVLISIYRWVLQIAGPLIGVWMGVRLSRRLQRWLGELSITLHQTDSQEIALGTVFIPTNGDFEELQGQAEMIVGRLKESQSELNQIRMEVLKSERLAAVGELAAGVAHELRNPLTSVKLLLQHASRRGGISTLSDDQLKLILDEFGRMESTIEGLLHFSRQQPLRVSAFDCRQAVQRAVNLIEPRARQQAVTVQWEPPASPVLMNGDMELINQVVVNLCINAIDSMSHGGVLKVAIHDDCVNQMIQVVIEDTGPGISAEILPKLFEPFFTTKDRGTGLGLAISRRIVTQHGGTLMAKNAADHRGAVFTVELPGIPGTAENLERTSQWTPS